MLASPTRAHLLNLRFAKRLGWSPGDVDATAFDSTLVERVRARQASLAVPVDGVLGPLSYAALLARRGQELRAALTATPADLALAGRLATVETKRLWLQSIVDPPTSATAFAPSRDVIDHLIRSPEGLGWAWEAPYQHDGDFEWCGTLAAWAWRAAGVTLPLRRKYFASTYRLDRYARYAPVDDATVNPRPTDQPRRWLALDEHASPEDAWFADDDPPRAGDILLVGPAAGDYGKHICIVEHFDPVTGTFITIEGNGTGALPSGARAHGIIRTQRPVGLAHDDPRTRYHARRLIRPSIHDLAR